MFGLCAWCCRFQGTRAVKLLIFVLMIFFLAAITRNQNWTRKVQRSYLGTYYEDQESPSKLPSKASQSQTSTVSDEMKSTTEGGKDTFLEEIDSDEDEILDEIKSKSKALKVLKEAMKNRMALINNVVKNKEVQSEKPKKDGFEGFMNGSLVGEMNTTIHQYGYERIEKECRELVYEPLTQLPKTSVVITFHNTERLDNILRTIRSIFKRTPRDLLGEIVLIADMATQGELTTVLDDTLAAINRPDLITLKRSTEQLGLIKARLWGIRVARGPVVFCMDSHMEVQEGWLEPLVYEIYKNHKALVSPSLDWMSFNKTSNVWTMKHGGSTWKTFFDWSLGFGWQNMSPSDLEKHKENVTQAFESPVSIGTFGIAKEWFIEVGELDDGMDAWGGENIDLPLRVWLFGGRVLNVPCSHIAHYEEKGSRGYRKDWMPIILRNHKRVVDVWWDDYKEYFYYYNPDLALINPGELSQRFEVKLKAAHNFTWFLNNVYPELGMYDVDVLANGGVRNLEYPDKCIHGGGGGKYRLYNCTELNRFQQGIYLTMSGDLRYPTYRAKLLHLEKQKKYQLIGDGVIASNGSRTNTIWIHWENGPLIDSVRNLCLEAIDEDTLGANGCNINKKSQQWQFKNYSPEYQELFKGGTDLQNKTPYLHLLSKILKAYKANKTP